MAAEIPASAWSTCAWTAAIVSAVAPSFARSYWSIAESSLALTPSSSASVLAPISYKAFTLS